MEDEDPYSGAEKFLAIASQYKLGTLVTELPHPDTGNLSNLAISDLSKAILILKKLDNQAVRVLKQKISQISALKDSISDTLRSGNNIFFCGCGATGRLSLTLETIWRQVHQNDELTNRVYSFIAGGDVALIRSIENFEDITQYGARQLEESGFRDGDLLVATTEGGETPFVIGAVERAGQISARKHFFLYCNPDDILCNAAERSKRVIENQAIKSINLTVGPMAVTGSTRMQASTILLASAGFALFHFNESDSDIEAAIDAFIRYWESADLQFLAQYIILETGFYQDFNYLLYQTDNNLAISIITDTTERSPTFSLYPFENINEPEEPLSLCYLYMPDYEDSAKAWKGLLWRAPRTLEWPEIKGIASHERLLGFDFSRKLLTRKQRHEASDKHRIFKIIQEPHGISFSLANEVYLLVTPDSDPLISHLVLKMVLNTLSTLIMGKLGRYEGNVMTYVRASNNKLIDRAIRYIDMILKNDGIVLSYSDICHVLFKMIKKTPMDQSIVLAVVAEIEKRGTTINHLIRT